MNWYEGFLKRFFHDPIDKPFDIPTHKKRTEEYAGILGIFDLQDANYSDQIASCMERSLLPKEIKQKFNEIRHPLSDEKIDFWCIVDIAELKEIIKEALKEIDQKVQNNEEKAFYIWRNLLEIILEKTKDKEYRRFFPLIPADTRVPDHSIWEHLKVTSSINAYERYQNNSLFLFSIGPVQSFISQARKTQDFFMGSFIMSYITFIAMGRLIETYGPTSIIYPDLYKQPLMDLYLRKKGIEINNSTLGSISLPTIPNRFVAIIGETDRKKITDLVIEMKKAIKTEFENAQKEIFKQLKIEPSDELKNHISNQIKDFPHIFWTAIPWRVGDRDLMIDDLKDFFKDKKIKDWKELWNFAQDTGEYPPNIGFIYQLLYTTLEKSLGARKNLREFGQYYESGRKCSVCGERNVLFFRESKNKNKFKRYNPFAKDLSSEIPLKYLSEGEGLCLLCFIKRTFEIYLEKGVDTPFKDFSFPTTADIASMDFLKEASKQNEFLVYKKQFEDITKKEFSPYWLYKENLTEESFKEELEISVVGERLENLKELLSKIKRPNPYYAIIHLDGDNMGKWLSGENLPEIAYTYNSEVWQRLPTDFKERLKEHLGRLNSNNGSKKFLTPAIHSAISIALRNYSIEFVRKIVEVEHLGKVVYAGGDDVLAFVNLQDLFDVMEKLRWAFSGHIRFENGEIKIDLNETRGFVEKDGVYYLTMGKNASCSMGVVIAHYKEPLQIVIKKVFEMEKKAKCERKDRFAIGLIKRSGEEKVGVLEWKYGNLKTTEILKTLKDQMNSKRKEYYFSDGFIQKIKNEFLKLKDKENRLVCSEILFTTELSRLISRAFNSKKKISDEKKRGLIKKFDEDLKSLLASGGGIDNIDNFTSFLEIASFMNKGD